MTLADRMGHAFGRVLTRSNLADYLLVAGEVSSARDAAVTARELAVTHGLVGLASLAEGNVATCEAAAGNHPDAVRLGTRAASTMEQHGLHGEAAHIWSVVAMSASELGLLAVASDAEAHRLRLDATQPAPH